MHQFEEFRPRPGGAQLFDDAEAHAAAAVHGHAGGLVDGQHVIVLVQDGEFARRCARARALFGARGHPHRRQAHHVAGADARVGLRAALVDAHLARADDAVDVGLRDALEVAEEKVVQTLAGRFFIHRKKADFSGRRLRLRTYNIFHQRNLVSA
jgi:hypothetical protein